MSDLLRAAADRRLSDSDVDSQWVVDRDWVVSCSGSSLVQQQPYAVGDDGAFHVLYVLAEVNAIT